MKLSLLKMNGVKLLNKELLLLASAMICMQPVFAHSINYALESAPAHEVVWFYLKLGFTHILPSGADHILFVMGLCLLSTKIKTILWQATAFTVAHSITLAMSMKNIIVAPSPIVEVIIAMSILFVAVENVLFSELKPWRIAIVFLFGLIHGMGFASALNEIGLPTGKFYTSIIAFNAGVELGQMAVIAVMFSLFILPFRNKVWYRKRIVYGFSACIGLVAAFWTVERISFLNSPQKPVPLRPSLLFSTNKHLMKKESIVQFVCFATKLEPAEFSPLWKEFAKGSQADSINLYEVQKKDKNRFRYISRLSSKNADFRFAFMKGRNSDHFPEQSAKVIQLGGYSTIQLQAAKKKKANEVKVMAFMEQNSFDLDFCKKQEYTSLDIYEAYYENCKYSYIMEYVLPEAEAEGLVEKLNAHGGIDVTNNINALVNAKE